MSANSWLQLLLLGVVWGGTFVFAKVAIEEIHPLTLVLLRVGIAAIALHLYLLYRGPSFTLAFPYMAGFFFLALLNNVIPFSLIFLGQTELGAGLASVFYATTPFWTILVANVLTNDEKFSWNKGLGVLLGIIGTLIMVGPGLFEGLGGSNWAKLAVIGASISYAFAVIFAKRFRQIPSSVIATAQLTCSTVIMLPVVLLVVGVNGTFDASTHVWAAVIALGLISTALGFILYFNILASSGATNASLVTLVVPVSAILLGTLFLGEQLRLYELLGMTIIGLGLITIDGRVFERR
ncbi:DMT family transporter [Agrobacterium rhizogenes]|nr:DMT family transporter [Rhizobium rhizogenes]NTG10029.1 DMT family transporter [Rhizobium rhizogenes]